MRVIHIFSGLYQGGAESQLEKLIYHSRSTEVEHIVISLKNDETPLMKKLMDNGIDVYCMGFNGWRSVLGFYKLKVQLKLLMTNSSVIQCWMYHANFFGLLTAYSLGMSNRVVWNIRRTQLPKGITGVFAKLCAIISNRIPVKIICCAEAAKVSHVIAGYNEKNISVIHNGIDIDLFIPNVSARNKFRIDLGFSTDDMVVGMVGRYAPIKGHIYLLQAFHHLLSDIENIKIKLVLVGRGIKNADNLQSLLNVSELDSHLTIMNERSDIWNVMPGFDLLCMPSESEGFPNVVAEAMSCGVPVLVTDVGDASIIVENTDMVVEPCKPMDIVDKISLFYQLPIKERMKYSESVRTQITSRFSIEMAWIAYRELYNQLIEFKK